MLTPLLAAFEASPVLFLTTLFLFGAIVGSFLNVVIHRLPLMMEARWRADCSELLGVACPAAPPLTLSQPPSHCPACKAPVRAYDNLPILGWLLLKGRCRDCGTGISVRYPIIEFTAAVLAVLVGLRFGVTPAALLGLVLVWSLLALAVIDLNTQLLPDDITQPLLWLGIVCGIFKLYVPLEAAVIGAVSGYLGLWSVFQAYRLATGKLAMGHGDFKLYAALGAWLGYELLPMVILLSSFVGAGIGIGMVVSRGHDSQVPIPFGPYLAAAGVLAFLAGDRLHELWLRWLGL
jgi:leader peptidase (prepilin peptidase) / N-methyltransferase